MEIIMFLSIGLVSGWIASAIVKGQSTGMLFDIIIGIIGAFFGGYIFRFFDINVYGIYGALATSIVGAVVFLYLVRIIFKRDYRRKLEI